MQWTDERFQFVCEMFGLNPPWIEGQAADLNTTREEMLVDRIHQEGYEHGYKMAQKDMAFRAFTKGRLDEFNEIVNQPVPLIEAYKQCKSDPTETGSDQKPTD